MTTEATTTAADTPAITTATVTTDNVIQSEHKNADERVKDAKSFF